MEDNEKGKPHPSETLEFVTVPTSGYGGLTLPPAEKVARPRWATKHKEDLKKVSAPSGESNGRDDVAQYTDHQHESTALDNMFADLSRTVAGYDTMVNKSQAAHHAEHAMTFREGLKLYPKGIAWSALLSLTLVMEGYDLAIVNGFFALPQFRRRYGEPTASSGYQITPKWQSALTNGAVAGEIVGLFANGETREFRKHSMLFTTEFSI